MTATCTFITALALLASSATWAQGCGGLANHYGPFDYRTERDRALHIVEQHHFTPQVEALIKGQEGWIGGDLDYVLMTSPNHHRALLAVVRYSERTKSNPAPNMPYTVDCYFDRAMRFQPDDTVVREMYAEYLTKQGRPEDARKELQAAIHYAGDNGISHYNIGLLYFGLKDYDGALAQAQEAARLGYGRPELRHMLEGVGKWKDVPAPVAAASSPDSAVAPVAAASGPP